MAIKIEYAKDMRLYIKGQEIRKKSIRDEIKSNDNLIVLLKKSNALYVQQIKIVDSIIGQSRIELNKHLKKHKARKKK